MVRTSGRRAAAQLRLNLENVRLAKEIQAKKDQAGVFAMKRGMSDLTSPLI